MWKGLEKQALYYSLWELWQDCFVTWIKSWNVRGSKSSISPMSLQKRFKILPERTGYEKLLISSDRNFKRNNSWTNKNNIFEEYVFQIFPGGTVSHYRGHVFNPWSRKIPHAAEQLSLCTTTTEAHVPRSWALQQKKPPQWEAKSLQWTVTLACYN